MNEKDLKYRILWLDDDFEPVETAVNQDEINRRQSFQDDVEYAAEYGIEERLVRRIIRNQVNRTQGAPLYDLDFDLQLKAAMEVLQGGEYKTLVKKTKTLKQLQEEVELKEKKDKKDKK